MKYILQGVLDIQSICLYYIGLWYCIPILLGRGREKRMLIEYCRILCDRMKSIETEWIKLNFQKSLSSEFGNFTIDFKTQILRE